MVNLVNSLGGLDAVCNGEWCSKASLPPQTHLPSDWPPVPPAFAIDLQISTGLDSATTFEICTRLRAICHLMHVSGRGAVCPMRSRRNPASRAVQQEELGAYRQAVAALPSLPLKP